MESSNKSGKLKNFPSLIGMNLNYCVCPAQIFLRAAVEEQISGNDEHRGWKLKDQSVNCKIS